MQAGRDLLGSDDLAPCFALELEISAGMVVMVMGVENEGEGPSLALKSREVRGCVRRVDGSGRSSVGVVDQVAIIVT